MRGSDPEAAGNEAARVEGVGLGDFFRRGGFLLIFPWACGIMKPCPKAKDPRPSESRMPYVKQKGYDP